MTADGAMPCIAEPGLRAKRIAVKFAGDPHEFAKRLRRAQHRHMGRNLASKRGLTRQAPALVAASWSAYFRLSKNVRCIGPASSSEARPLTCWPPREGSTNMRLRQRGDFSQRRRRRLLEECRLRHSTRRGPAGEPGSVRIEPTLCIDAFFTRTGPLPLNA